jgi:hypothetical protein
MFKNGEVRLEMRRHLTENEEMALFLHLKKKKKIMSQSISLCYIQFVKCICYKAVSVSCSLL